MIHSLLKRCKNPWCRAFTNPLKDWFHTKARKQYVIVYHLFLIGLANIMKRLLVVQQTPDTFLIPFPIPLLPYRSPSNPVLSMNSKVDFKVKTWVWKSESKLSTHLFAVVQISYHHICLDLISWRQQRYPGLIRSKIKKKHLKATTYSCYLMAVASNEAKWK